jgi:hypothetical protein
MSKPYQKKSKSVSKKRKQSNEPAPKPTAPTAPIDDAENCECCQAIRRFAELCPEHVLEEVAKDIPGLVAELRQHLHDRAASIPLTDAALFVAWRMTRNTEAKVAMDQWVGTLKEFVYFQDYFKDDDSPDEQAAPAKAEVN